MLNPSSGSPPAMHDPYLSSQWVQFAVNSTITSSSVDSVTAAMVPNTTFSLDNASTIMEFDTYAPTAVDELRYPFADVCGLRELFCSWRTMRV